MLRVPHPGDRSTGRRPKDYHLELDHEGDVIVSQTVWARLEQARQSGLSPHRFLVMNEVLDPPGLVVGGPPGPALRMFRQEHDALREICPTASVVWHESGKR